MNLPTTLIQIPAPDLERYARLPADVKSEVRLWIAAMADLTAAAAGVCKRGAAVVKADYAAKLDVSRGTVDRKWAEWQKSGGDWTVLVNRAKAGRAWWNTE